MEELEEYEPEDLIAEHVVHILGEGNPVTIYSLEEEEDVEATPYLRIQAEKQGIVLLYIFPVLEGFILMNPVNLRYALLSSTTH